ncbi:PASTA domain-containing protein, partial [uncultured Nitrospira sp.]|uniref:PASTA domain-containing protein n=1 Tax=uncultured Nitrospira sp. TaxID=157176 RepID=UPI003140C228
MRLVVFVSLVFLTFIFPATARAVEVPNFIGIPQATAESDITSLGLTVGVVTAAISGGVPIGNVISHDPAAGINVVSGSQVDLVISGVGVPSVVGLAQAAAQSAITDAGLSVGPVTAANNATVPIGNVISQNPAAGTNVFQGDAVAFVVSLGIEVPNVVGMPQGTAQTAITGVGLSVGTVTSANSATVPIGNVISQNPLAGTNVEAGSAVALLVSVGAAVPNVVGLAQLAAQSAITNAGLTVGTVTSANSATVPIGNVISQNPVSGGGNVEPGSPVAFVVSLGTAVPNVVGLAQAAAQTAITNVGLTVGTVTQAGSATVPAGDVISQNPGGGNNVEPGSTVALVVSLGPAVPNVVGLMQAAAQTAITSAGLTVGSVTSTNSQTVAIGNVISQTPVAGTNVAPGTAVNLVTSLGTAVPNVVGLAQAAAQTAITNVGLIVGTVTQAGSATVPAGDVISQNPGGGNNVEPGSTVALVVSLGPVVPNVVGLTQAAAQTAITSAGLTVGTVTTATSVTVPIGNVISQTPASGTSVTAGSVVNLVVSLGAAVPNVVGLAQAAAQTAITTAGLTVGTVTTATSATVAIGAVISQNPIAGVNVTTGSAVNLVVSLGAQVPNVVGLTQGIAQTALTTAGLIVGTVTPVFSDTVLLGNVISQNPTAGTNVAPGSVVALEVSSGPPNFLMGVQNDPRTGPLVNSLYRLRTDGIVTKITDLTHRTHGLAFVGSMLYSVEELTLAQQPGTPPKIYRLNPDTGATLGTISLSLSTGESLEGGRGLATEPGTNQLWGLLVVTSEVNSARRLVTINPLTGLATQKAKMFGNFMDLAFDSAGTLYAITDNRQVSGGAVAPARIYTVNKTTGATTEFLDVSAGAVAGQPNFRESETIGVGTSSDLLFHLSGQHKVTSGFTKNILFETINLNNKARTEIALTGPDFFVTTALTLVPPMSPGRSVLGDLDASGTTDLVWRNTSDGSTAIWLMNGPIIASSGFPGGVPLAWQISGVGDVNGDGKADVIWRNATGTVAVWLMNGVSVTSLGFPGSASTAFEIAGVGDV